MTLPTPANTRHVISFIIPWPYETEHLEMALEAWAESNQAAINEVDYSHNLKTDRLVYWVGFEDPKSILMFALQHPNNNFTYQDGPYTAEIDFNICCLPILGPLRDKSYRSRS